MRLKLNRSILLDEVNKASKIVDLKSVNPELLGIYFDLQPEGLTIMSTNGNMNWKSIINKEIDNNFEVIELGKMLLKGKYFLEILRKIDDDLIELEIVETNEIIIKGEKVRFNIQLLDANNFPMIGFREKGTELKIAPNELRKAISQTYVSIDEFNKKIVLTGMNFKVAANSDKLTLFSTDSFRVSKKVVKLNETVEEEIDFTIPFKTLNEVYRLLDGAKQAKLVVFEGYLLLSIDNHSLFQSTLIDGRFPNVDRAFPESFDTTITVNKSELIKALGRANLTSEEGMTPTVVLDINEDVIRFTSSSPEIGNFLEDFTNFEFEGETQKISFNIKYLTDALRSFEGNEVQLNFISPVKPLEIRSSSDDGLKQLVLPLSIG